MGQDDDIGWAQCAVWELYIPLKPTTARKTVHFQELANAPLFLSKGLLQDSMTYKTCTLASVISALSSATIMQSNVWPSDL